MEKFDNDELKLAQPSRARVSQDVSYEWIDALFFNGEQSGHVTNGQHSISSQGFERIALSSSHN